MCVSVCCVCKEESCLVTSTPLSIYGRGFTARHDARRLRFVDWGGGVWLLLDRTSDAVAAYVRFAMCECVSKYGYVILKQGIKYFFLYFLNSTFACGSSFVTYRCRSRRRLRRACGINTSHRGPAHRISLCVCVVFLCQQQSSVCIRQRFVACSHKSHGFANDANLTAGVCVFTGTTHKHTCLRCQIFAMCVAAHELNTINSRLSHKDVRLCKADRV